MNANSFVIVLYSGSSFVVRREFEFDVEAAGEGKSEDQFGWGLCSAAVVDQCRP